jgi:hypothetical protein
MAVEPQRKEKKRELVNLKKKETNDNVPVIRGSVPTLTLAPAHPAA